MMKNNKGVTLVELVIAMALISIVLALGYSLYYFGFNSVTDQLDMIDNQTNVRLAVKYITQELRRAQHVMIENGNVLRIRPMHTSSYNEFKLSVNSLLKDNTTLATGLGEFGITKVDRLITISITSTEDVNGNNFNIRTQVYLRE